jgi:RNA polymerase-binding protein DksA
MEKERINYFEKKLLTEREKIRTHLSRLQDTLFKKSQRDAAGEKAYSQHMAELGSDEHEREQGYQLATSEGRYLYHVDEALRRIQNGTYGLCERCKKEIDGERLEVVPTARFCINCKRLEEKEELPRKS